MSSMRMVSPADSNMAACANWPGPRACIAFSWSDVLCQVKNCMHGITLAACVCVCVCRECEDPHPTTTAVERGMMEMEYAQ